MINSKFLKNKNIEELNKDLSFLLKEKFNLKMQLYLNKIKKNHLIRNCKKKIIIIKTILTEKKKYEKKK